MAWTQTDVDKLKAAIGQGATKVKFADREVTYRSLDEMRETLGMLQAEVDALAGVKRRRSRQVRFITSKGLY
jgi:hypothetical protein